MTLFDTGTISTNLVLQNSDRNCTFAKVAVIYMSVAAFFLNLLETVYGGVAQLGERDVRNVEASGSIPLTSTNIRVLR